MTKSVFATFVHLALASEEDFALHEDGLSLLQTHVHKHEESHVRGLLTHRMSDESRTALLQGAEYFEGPLGTECAPGEVLTLAQCLEVQDKRLIPHGIADWSIMGSKRSTTTHKIPAGCSRSGTQMEWSDEPVGFAHFQYRPVCSKNGGRAAEIAAKMVGSCQEPTCAQPPGDHLLNWVDDGVIVPELISLPTGSVCEPCGILTYAQCAKAGDMGMIEAVTGIKIKRYPQLQCNGGGHSKPAVPSGCYIFANHLASFCPFDTPDGALAGWVSDSGVGVGWGRGAPVCGVCTTTTTTPEPPIVVDEPDEAGAVGDPHMTQYPTGKHLDYSAH